jgi:hypothetical protein
MANGVVNKSRFAILAWGPDQRRECCKTGDAVSKVGEADSAIGEADIVVACEGIDYALDVTHRWGSPWNRVCDDSHLGYRWAWHARQ